MLLVGAYMVSAEILDGSLELTKNENFDTMPNDFFTNTSRFGIYANEWAIEHPITNFTNEMPTQSDLDYFTAKDNWRIQEGELIADDFYGCGGNDAGSLIYIFNDKNNYRSNYTVSVDIFREKYPTTIRRGPSGIIIGYNPESSGVYPNPIYYIFSTSNSQAWFLGRGDGWVSNIWNTWNYQNLTNEKHKMQINVYDDIIQLIYNEDIVTEINRPKHLTNGHVGLYVLDSSRDFYSRTHFDNFKVYETPIITTSNEGDNYYANVTTDSEAPIQNITFIVEKETDNSNIICRNGFCTGENITTEIIYTNTTSFSEEDNVTNFNESNEFKYIEKPQTNIIVRWYYKITDWFGGIFKTTTNEI